MTIADLTGQAPDWAPWALLAALAVIVLALVVSLAHTARGRHRDATNTKTPGRRLEAALTLGAAGVATAGAWNGMLHVFQHRLHMNDIEAYSLAGFLEIAMVSSGIRARRRVKADLPAGADGRAVWVLAAASATLSASAEPDTIGRVTRLALPMVAAWMWERFLTGDRPGGTRIMWRWSLHRVAVLLGIADVETRGVDEVARARRFAGLAKLRVRTQSFEANEVPRLVAILTARSWRHAFAVWREQRAVLRAVEHDGLGADPAAAERVLNTTAAVFTFHASTSPTALETVSPWAGKARRKAPATQQNTPPQTPDPAQPMPGRDSGLAQPPGPARTNGVAHGPRIVDLHTWPTGPDVAQTVDQDDPLWPAAVRAARSIRARGETVTKRSMAQELRSMGHTCGGDRASALAQAVRTTANGTAKEATADA